MAPIRVGAESYHSGREYSGFSAKVFARLLAPSTKKYTQELISTFSARSNNMVLSNIFLLLDLINHKEINTEDKIPNIVRVLSSIQVVLVRNITPRSAEIWER